MAIGNNEVAALKNATVIGADGEHLGTVEGIYNDNETDVPAWATVKTDRPGRSVSLVPLDGALMHGADLHVPFADEQLESAPHHDPGRDLSRQDEIDLLRHYRVSYDAGHDSELLPEPAPGPTTSAVDRDADTSDSTGEAMTRSEEQLRVHTESRAVERVRLRKRVVTGYEQITVPLRREELTVERVPVDGASTPVAGDVGPDMSSPADGDDEWEIILYAERPVVRTETVPVERIRLVKHTVTDQETVGAEVRREEIELDNESDQL